jgi:tetratricopeptide (TPR) repeat protein
LLGEDDAPIEAVTGVLASGLIGMADQVLTFHHDLLREAVLTGVAPTRARVLHRPLADYYLTDLGEPLLAASHARAGATSGDTGSALILVRAAEQLVAISVEDAAEFAELAFRTVRATQPEWFAIGRRCLAVLCRTERADAAIGLADELLARVDDPDLVAMLEAEAAQALWLTGRLGPLTKRLDRAVELPGISPGPSARLRAARALVASRIRSAEAAADEATIAVELARLAGDTGALAAALRAAGEAAKNEGRHAAALAHFREMREVTGAPYVPGEITALQFLDRYQHAETLLQQARSARHSESNPCWDARHSYPSA